MRAARAFTSLLAPDIVRYLTVKQALGREYEGVGRVLAHVDHFVTTRGGDLTPATFAGWCLTLQHLASGTRRRRMQIVRNFCLYRRRGLPAAFVPDERLFPPEHQVVRPHLFTEAEVLRLLDRVNGLPPAPTSPFAARKPPLGDRDPVYDRLATRGAGPTFIARLRRARADVADPRLEVSQVALGATLKDGAREIDWYLAVRQTRQLATSSDSALFWHRTRRGTAYTGTGLSHAIRPLLRAAQIRPETGRVPRLHDFRTPLPSKRSCDGTVPAPT